MDEIEELKRSLGPAARNYNDSQLRHLSREIDLMAEFLLDLHMLRRSGEQRAKTTGFDTHASEPVA